MKKNLSNILSVINLTLFIAVLVVAGFLFLGQNNQATETPAQTHNENLSSPTIEIIEDNLEDMEQTVQALLINMEYSQDFDDETEIAITEILISIQNYKEDLNDLTEDYEELNIVDYSYPIELLQSQINTISNTISNINFQAERELLEAQIEVVAEQVANIDYSVDLSVLQNQINALNTALQSVNYLPEIELLQQDINALNQTILNLPYAEDIESLQNQIDSFNALIENMALNERFDNLQSQVNALVTALADQNYYTEIEVLQNQVNLLNIAFANITTSDYSQEIANLQNQINYLNSYDYSLEINNLYNEYSNLRQDLDNAFININDLWLHTDNLDANQQNYISSVQNDLWNIYHEVNDRLDVLELGSSSYAYDELRNELNNLQFYTSENFMFVEDRLNNLENEWSNTRNDINNAWFEITNLEHRISSLEQTNNTEFILRDIHQEHSIEDIYIDFMGMNITPQNYDDLVNMTSYNNDIWFVFDIDMFNQTINFYMYRNDEFGNQLSNELENSTITLSIPFEVDNGSIADEIEVMFEDLFVIFLDSYIRFDLDDNDIITYAHSTLDYQTLAQQVNDYYMNMESISLMNYNFIQFELDYYFNGQRVFGYYDINVNVNVN